MTSKTLKVNKTGGIHARVAQAISEKSQAFESHVTIKHRNSVVDAKSVLSIVGLGVLENSVIEVSVDGSDEEAALDAIVDLLVNQLEVANE